MRITRNYMSNLLNGNNKSSNASSLLQSALSRSNRGRRSRLSVQNSRTASLGKISTSNLPGSANSEKLYYNMKYHAGQVYVYAERLNGKNKDSVYEKAKTSGSTSFASRIALRADSVASYAERSMTAQASSAYSSLFNNYGSKGNYFNFFR